MLFDQTLRCNDSPPENKSSDSGPGGAVRDELRFDEALSASKHEERTLSQSPQEGTLNPIFA